MSLDKLPGETPESNPFDNFINHELDFSPLDESAQEANGVEEADAQPQFQIPQDIIDSAISRHQERVTEFLDRMFRDTTPEERQAQLEIREREIVEALKALLARDFIERYGILPGGEAWDERIAEAAVIALLADRQLPPVLTPSDVMAFLPDSDVQEDTDEEPEQDKADERPAPSTGRISLPPVSDTRWRRGRVFVQKDLIVFDQPRWYSRRSRFENARWRLKRDALYIAGVAPGWTAIHLPHHNITGFIRNGEANVLPVPRLLRIKPADLAFLLAVLALIALLLANFDQMPFQRAARVHEATTTALQSQIDTLQATIEALHSTDAP